MEVRIRCVEFTLGNQICVNEIVLLSLHVSKPVNEAPLILRRKILIMLYIFHYFVNIGESLPQSCSWKFPEPKRKCIRLWSVFKSQRMDKRVPNFPILSQNRNITVWKVVCIKPITRICKLWYSLELLNHFTDLYNVASGAFAKNTPDSVSTEICVSLTI